MKLNPKIKAIASDVLRVAIPAAAVLSVFPTVANAAHIPHADVVYVSMVLGALNGLIGVLRPIAAKKAKSVMSYFGGNK